jgi:hypothetical protein
LPNVRGIIHPRLNRRGDGWFGIVILIRRKWFASVCQADESALWLELKCFNQGKRASPFLPDIPRLLSRQMLSEG